MTRKRILMLIGCVCLALMLAVPMVASCAAPTPAPMPTPTPTPTPAPTPTPTPTPSGDVIHWTMLMYYGPGIVWGTFDTTVAEFTRRIWEGTHHRLKVEVLFGGEHPYENTEMLRALTGGVGDMVVVSHMCGGDEPRLKVSTAMPFLVPRGDFELDKMINRKLADEPLFRDIFTDWGGEYLTSIYHGSQSIYMKNTIIRSPEDLKGKKLRVPHETNASVVRAMGGDPIRVAWSETYTALTTGLVDGIATGFYGCIGMGFIDLCPYICWMNFNFSPYRLVASKKSLEALPADVRKDLISTIKGLEDWWMSGNNGVSIFALEETIFTKGTTIYTISPEWRADLRAHAYERTWKPILDDAGPPGRQIFDVMAKLITAEGYEVAGYTPK